MRYSIFIRRSLLCAGVLALAVTSIALSGHDAKAKLAADDNLGLQAYPPGFAAANDTAKTAIYQLQVTSVTQQFAFLIKAPKAQLGHIVLNRMDTMKAIDTGQLVWASETPLAAAVALTKKSSSEIGKLTWRWQIDTGEKSYAQTLQLKSDDATTAMITHRRFGPSAQSVEKIFLVDAQLYDGNGANVNHSVGARTDL